MFHRCDGLLDGRRLVIDIDEFWKALGDDAFRAFAQDGLKTYRKQNAFLVFGTQSPAESMLTLPGAVNRMLSANRLSLPCGRPSWLRSICVPDWPVSAPAAAMPPAPAKAKESGP